MLELNQRHSLWGQAFEISVKRGVLTALLASGILRQDHVDLERWKQLDTADVYGALARELRTCFKSCYAARLLRCAVL